MSIPSLPSQGSTAWYPWAQGVHTAASSAIQASDLGTGNSNDAALNAAFGSDLTDTGYDAVLLLGQSNMVGNGAGSVAANIDITDPRIWAYAPGGTYAGQIVQASDPLTHRSGAANVIGPGLPFARWLIDTMPGNRRVLLIPAAYNDTAFGSGTPRWDPTTAWPNDSANLFNLAIGQAQDAIAAAPNTRLTAALWIQGESDVLAGMGAATYRTYLEQLIDGLRSRLSLPNLPFVIGSMAPEFTSANGSAAAAIDGVHQATPTRKRYTAYVAGPTGMIAGDVLHYTAAGARELGRRLVGGLAQAKANNAPASAVPDNPPTPPAAAATADNFNRANALTLGSTPTGGHPWTVYSPDSAAVYGIDSNQAYLQTQSGNEGHATFDDALADFTMTITVAHDVASGTGVLFRYADTANYWLIFDNAGTWNVDYCQAGSFHAVGTAGPAASGDILRIDCRGTSISLAVNGTTTFTTTSSLFATATKKGLWTGSLGVGSRWDDLTVTA